MSNRGRRRTRLAGSFAVLAMLATMVPVIALATAASAAAPPVQDTTAFCAGGPTGNPFPDVTDPTDPHFANISCAKDAGIVQGKTDGLYHPNENTSRAQMASLVAREADKMVALAAPGKTLTPLPAAGSNP
ncbi:MAG TPA: S-layer homology domain-containing protein, partial [Acidimicrobiales bacterium]|nr:S-layer homology domain-containing protein [Acidimicrobiales bacterium]